MMYRELEQQLLTDFMLTLSHANSLYLPNKCNDRSYLYSLSRKAAVNVFRTCKCSGQCFSFKMSAIDADISPTLLDAAMFPASCGGAGLPVKNYVPYWSM